MSRQGVRLEDLRPVRLEPQHLPKPERLGWGVPRLLDLLAAVFFTDSQQQ